FPDGWVIIRIKNTLIVFACWSGGYAQSDSWKLNSGIKLLEEFPNHYKVMEYSDRKYILNINEEDRLNAYVHSILQIINRQVKDRYDVDIEIIPVEDEEKIING